MGPIQIFVLGFDDFAATGGVVAELTALSDVGTIRIIDARMLCKEPDLSISAVRVTDLTDDEREELRAAAGAFLGLGAGAVLAGEEGAELGTILGAGAAMAGGEFGLGEDDLAALVESLEPGSAVLLLVIENVWAAGLSDALRHAGVNYAEHDYVTPEGLVALGALMGLDTVPT